MKNKYIIFFSFIFYIYNQNKIEIIFKSNKSPNYLPNRFLSEFYDINLFANIEIGSNNQEINIPIKINKYLTYINSSKFNYNSSSSYNKIDNELFNSTDDNFISGYKSSDNFKIGNRTINNFIFYLSKNQKINENGTLGLKMQPIKKDLKYTNSCGIIEQLKKDKIISSYNFYFNFYKSEKLGQYSGKLILGAAPHEFESSKLFSEKNFVYANIQKNIYNTTWNIYFMKINFGNKLVEEQQSIYFSTDFGLIHAPIFFQSSMIKYFFSQNNCFLDNNGYFNYFYCNENVDISKFENLYFESLYEQINFTLTYKDLFYKIENRNYFLILFNNDTYTWKFGIHFFSKFTLVFNADKQTIGYYYSPINNNELENKEVSKNYLLYILLIISFIIIIFIIVIVYLLSIRNRKLRPNELEDEYDYTINKLSNSKLFKLNN